MISTTQNLENYLYGGDDLSKDNRPPPMGWFSCYTITWYLSIKETYHSFITWYRSRSEMRRRNRI